MRRAIRSARHIGATAAVGATNPNGKSFQICIEGTDSRKFTHRNSRDFDRNRRLSCSSAVWTAAKTKQPAAESPGKFRVAATVDRIGPVLHAARRARVRNDGQKAFANEIADHDFRHDKQAFPGRHCRQRQVVMIIPGAGTNLMGREVHGLQPCRQDVRSGCDGQNRH